MPAFEANCHASTWIALRKTRTDLLWWFVDVRRWLGTTQSWRLWNLDTALEKCDESLPPFVRHTLTNIYHLLHDKVVSFHVWFHQSLKRRSEWMSEIPHFAVEKQGNQLKPHAFTMYHFPWLDKWTSLRDEAARPEKSCEGIGRIAINCTYRPSL